MVIWLKKKLFCQDSFSASQQYYCIQKYCIYLLFFYSKFPWLYATVQCGINYIKDNEYNQFLLVSLLIINPSNKYINIQLNHNLKIKQNLLLIEFKF